MTDEERKGKNGNANLWRDVQSLLKSPSFCLLVLVGGGVQVRSLSPVFDQTFAANAFCTCFLNLEIFINVGRVYDVERGL